MHTVLKLIDHWNNRAAAFFTSFALTLGVLSTNMSANSFSAGDMAAALWPRYINIQRGWVIFLGGGWTLLSMGNIQEVRASQKKTLEISFHGDSLILGCIMRRAS
jgi:cytosine/uracil/thiamine/allantoin permease